MTKRALHYRVMEFLSDYVYELPYLRGFPTRWKRPTENLLSHVEKAAGRWLCQAFGHMPTMDHCGMPEHDYCMGCHETTPGQAPHRMAT